MWCNLRSSLCPSLVLRERKYVRLVSHSDGNKTESMHVHVVTGCIWPYCSYRTPATLLARGSGHRWRILRERWGSRAPTQPPDEKQAAHQQTNVLLLGPFLRHILQFLPKVHQLWPRTHTPHTPHAFRTSRPSQNLFASYTSYATRSRSGPRRRSIRPRPKRRPTENA